MLLTAIRDDAGYSFQIEEEVCYDDACGFAAAG
jgi:hypothetical protein